MIFFSFSFVCSLSLFVSVTSRMWAQTSSPQLKEWGYDNLFWVGDYRWVWRNGGMVSYTQASVYFNNWKIGYGNMKGGQKEMTSVLSPYILFSCEQPLHQWSAWTLLIIFCHSQLLHSSDGSFAVDSKLTVFDVLEQWLSSLLLEVRSQLAVTNICSKCVVKLLCTWVFALDCSDALQFLSGWWTDMWQLSQIVVGWNKAVELVHSTSNSDSSIFKSPTPTPS